VIETRDRATGPAASRGSHETVGTALEYRLWAIARAALLKCLVGLTAFFSR
jgi:hypothetical protein